MRWILYKSFIFISTYPKEWIIQHNVNQLSNNKEYFMLFSNINVMESDTCDTNLMRCGCDKVSVIWISLETIRWVLLSSFPLSIILTATRSVIKSQDRRWKRWQTFHVRHHHHHHQQDYLVAHFCWHQENI